MLAARLVLLCALRVADNAIKAAQDFRPIATETVEGSGRDQAFHDAAVDLLWIDPQAEVLDRGEGLVAANLDNMLDRGLSNALDGRKGVVNLVLVRFEPAEGRLH